MIRQVHAIEVAARALALAALVVTAAGSPMAHALSAAGDFDGDGKDEVLLRHGAGGEWVYYDLDTDGAKRREPALRIADTHRLAGTGDFDGDGEAEILARDIDGRAWRYFNLSSGSIVEPRMPALTWNAYWSVAATGDFDGDGTDDIMLRSDDSGESLYYVMGGSTVTVVRDIGVTADTLYKVMGAGDFNGDGMDDILLRHAHDGEWIYYDMAGAKGVLRQPDLTLDLLFQFKAIGDFNGDGRDDILLRHANGEWIYYAMGANHLGEVTRQFGMSQDLAHDVVAVGDFDGNGHAGPLLRHPHTGSWLSYDLSASPARQAGYPGMTTDTAWAAPASRPSYGFPGAVAAGSLVRKPANYFDLEGTTVTFTPNGDSEGDGKYAVAMSGIDWKEPGAADDTRTAELRDSDDHVSLDLPFAFPFAGRTWTRIYVNANGNISFQRREERNRRDRREGPDGTMRAVAAAIDSRSAAGSETMIAALWALYDGAAVTIDSAPSQVAVTWRASRTQEGGSGYAPLGENLFQARLHASGAVEFAYRAVPERDGIVGLFPGGNPRGEVLDSFDDPSGDVSDSDGSNKFMDITAVEFIDSGSTVLARMTLAGDLPDKVDEGFIHYRFFLRFGQAECQVRMLLWRYGSSPRGCDPAPGAVGLTVRGPVIEIPISKTLFNGSDGFFWDADAVWWGRDEREHDRVSANRHVKFASEEMDLRTVAGTVAGNSFEVFHYPSLAKAASDTLPFIYERAPASDEIAVVFTDFRTDDIFNSGPGTGPINERVEGIGRDRTANGERDYGSASLLTSMQAVFIGAPSFAETGTDGGRALRNFAPLIRWVAREAVRKWAVHLEFVDPGSGKVEDLEDDDHWDEYLHTPAMYPVWPGFADQSTDEPSVMGGNVWVDNGDGTFTRQDDSSPAPSGLSALDLYAMGMIPTGKVPDTFILRDVERTDSQDTVKATRAPIRIDDVVAAMGPRVPTADAARRDFRLGIYVIHEDGRPPRAELARRARAVSRAIGEYFDRATGGRMRVVSTVRPAQSGASRWHATYVADDALPGLPVSGSFMPGALAEGSYATDADGATVILNEGGWLELASGTRYTCTSADGCTIASGAVTAGAVVRRAADLDGGEGLPVFSFASGPGNRTFTVGKAITPLTLPSASGGDGKLNYSLSPSVPGLSFDEDARQLTGTPSSASTHLMTYRVTDADGGTDTLTFIIAVQVADDGEPADNSFEAGDSIAGLPAGAWFPHAISDARVAVVSDTTSITLDQAGSFEVGGARYICEGPEGCEVAGREVVSGTVVRGLADTRPSLSGAGDVGNPTYAVGKAIGGLELPAARGGNGPLGYSLLPEVPGLSFDAVARRLAGTPGAAGIYDLIYTVKDADGDTDAFTLRITVADRFGLLGGNEDPGWIAFADDRLHVVDWQDDRVYAYADAGSREALSDFGLDARNAYPAGITYADGRFYVVDVQGGRVYAYGAAGRRDAAADVALDDAVKPLPHGIAYAQGRFYVVDLLSGRVWAYSATGKRDASADFALDAANAFPRGITYTDGLFHVLDRSDRKIYAYSLAGGRVASADLALDANNGNPAGIAWASGRFYVADRDTDTVYAYPRPGQEAASAR